MFISRENYALLHMWEDHEGHANNEYMLISGILITRVVFNKFLNPEEARGPSAPV